MGNLINPKKIHRLNKNPPFGKEKEFFIGKNSL